MDQDERELVERAKSDAEAFGALYDRYVDDVHRFVRARLPNVTAAQDVTAEVFMKALRYIGGYQDQGRPFSCWLYRIATNAVADYFRHEPNLPELSEEMADRAMPVETMALRNLEVAELWNLINQLPPQQQLAMRLRFGEDRSAREAGRIMHKSDAAVKLLIYRAVARLRSQVGAAGPAPSAPAVS